MAAGRVVVPGYMPALDFNGATVGGAKLYVFQNRTTVPASIYTTSGLNVSLSNPVVADSGGQFPAVWADDGAQYTVSVVDSSGAPFGSPFTYDDLSVSVALGAIADYVTEAGDDAAAAAASAAAAAATLAGAVLKSQNGADFSSPAAVLGNIGAGTAATLASDTDATLAANSDARLATQKAVKSYIDTHVASFHYLATPVDAATTAALPACTYDNGAGTLTGNSNGALASQDGVTLTAGQSLLVKNQAASLQNGPYTVTQVGTGGTPFILTRRTDADTGSEILQSAVFVTGGTTQANTQWANLQTTSPTLGTDPITYGQVGASTSYSAGASGGLTLTGTVFAVDSTVARVGVSKKGDVNYTITTSDRTVVTNAALTAPRTWTLPAASSLTGGRSFVLQDTAGVVGATNTLTIAAAGSDTIDGAASIVLSIPYSSLTLRSDNVSKWTIETQIPAPVSRGGTGATSTSPALVNLGALSGADLYTAGDPSGSADSATVAQTLSNAGRLVVPKGTYRVDTKVQTPLVNNGASFFIDPASSGFNTDTYTVWPSTPVAGGYADPSQDVVSNLRLTANFYLAKTLTGSQWSGHSNDDLANHHIMFVKGRQTPTGPRAAIGMSPYMENYGGNMWGMNPGVYHFEGAKPSITVEIDGGGIGETYGLHEDPTKGSVVLLLLAAQGYSPADTLLQLQANQRIQNWVNINGAYANTGSALTSYIQSARYNLIGGSYLMAQYGINLEPGPCLFTVREISLPSFEVYATPTSTATVNGVSGIVLSAVVAGVRIAGAAAGGKVYIGAIGKGASPATAATIQLSGLGVNGAVEICANQGTYTIIKANYNGSALQLGFFGVTPVIQQTVSAALATDGSATNAAMATAINSLRTAIRAYGLAA